MGSLLYSAGVAMGRLLVEAQEAAIRRELQTLAGTLHDSLKPSLPHPAGPSSSLAVVLPGLCIAGEPCNPPADLIRRHAISATDPDRFKLRVLDRYGSLVASSPGSFPQEPKPGRLGWSLSSDQRSERWGSYTIHLHHTHTPDEATWGYLQIYRSMADLDAETRQFWRLSLGVFGLGMLGMAVASWLLAGLAMAPLLEAYRRQEQFSSDVAHELRTPLANLLALVEAERSSTAQVNPTATSSLDRVLVQGQRLQRLIADLLLLASLEQPVCRQAQELCNLAECLEDVIEDFSEIARAKGVILQLQMADSNALVRGQERELIRLLVNLLSNAIQHTPSGGMVRVELIRQASELRVAVTDQGPGIPVAEQHRIFERFYRSDFSRSRQSGGTGLGLAIAQAIARRHRGRLSVQSAPGTGSTFLLQMPAAT